MPGAVLGQGLGSARPHGSLRLPCVTELLDASVPDDNQPSCSVRVSLASRGLFVNDVAVRFAAQLLYELFSKERLDQHRVVVNLDSEHAGSIEGDPKTWAHFGYVVWADEREATTQPGCLR